MKLFNKYKNKDFIFITNYINNCINNVNFALTPNELTDLLLGTTQNTFKELISAILNKNSNSFNSKQPNADLFFLNDEEKLLPIRNNYIPIRPSIAEKAWLLYILKDPKAKLFLDENILYKLISTLENDINLPKIEKCIDIRKLTTCENKDTYTDLNIKDFKCIITAIKEHKELIITNTTFDGQIFKNQTIIPYKLEYSPQFDSFSLSAYPIDTKRPVKMNLLNLSNVILGKDISNYEQFVSDFEKQLTSIRVKTPITIEIKDDKNGYDRCSFKFSSFDRVCYENENGNLIMNIYYYRFQEKEILRNIMFLGPTVTIIGPNEIRDKYISTLKKALTKYKEAES